MTPDRLDDLLARSLESGAIPEDALPEERAELEPLLAARANLLAARDAVEAEALAAMPAARARFQRHLAAHRPSLAIDVRTVASRPPLLERLLGGRRLQLSASLAALLIVALAALLVTRPFQSVQEVQALGVDDYVQLTGTVTRAEGTTIVVEHPDLGTVTVDAAESAFVNADGQPLERQPGPGDHLLIAGIVRDARAGRILIDGQSLAAGIEAPDEPTGPFERLRNLPGTPEGTLRVLAIGPDGKRGRAILHLADGRRALVNVDGASLGDILTATGSPVGSSFRLARGVGQTFLLEPLNGRQGHQGGERHGIGKAPIALAGVIADVGPETFILRTLNGPVAIERRPRILVLPGTSGFASDDVPPLESLEGYGAVVAGVYKGDGTFRAEFIVLDARR